jgi:hypothetical protein|tara:strand:+ start:1152 stop:1640 length:489 start_codon:yes stop_codon:yes gene_type:complete
MKKLFLFLIVMTSTLCFSQFNGFTNFEGQNIKMGSQETVEIFMKIDEAWKNRDFKTLKSFVADDAKMGFEDGTKVVGPVDFIEKIKKEYIESQSNGGWGWNTDYAFSIKAINSKNSSAWNQKGEWVNAQFTSDNDKSIYIEWYQIYEGKIINWWQTKGDSSN